jgi:TetR/AcrR family transcriptional repressor of nem operon
MGRPREYDRDEVLQRAMTLFWKKGYEGTHLAELVEETGLNRFSLYKEFGGKEGLFSEALDRYMLELQPLSSLLARAPMGLGNIRDYFAAVVDARFIHGCFLLNTLPERHVVAPSTFKKIRDFVRHAEALFRGNLEAAQQAGQIAAETDLEALAKALFAFDIGFISYGILSVTKDEKRRMVSLIDRWLV